MKYSLQLRGKGWGNAPAVEVWLWNVLLSCSPGRCWNYRGYGESHARAGSLAKLQGCNSGPAETRVAFGDSDDTVWFLLLGSCDFSGSGRCPDPLWPVPAVCDDGFCSSVPCIFLPLLPNWKPNHIHRTAPGERWQRRDSCKPDRIITPTFTAAVSAAWIYNSEHYLDIVNLSNLHLVIKHGNKMNFGYKSLPPTSNSLNLCYPLLSSLYPFLHGPEHLPRRKWLFRKLILLPLKVITSLMLNSTKAQSGAQPR